MTSPQIRGYVTGFPTGSKTLVVTNAFDCTLLYYSETNCQNPHSILSTIHMSLYKIHTQCCLHYINNPDPCADWPNPLAAVNWLLSQTCSKKCFHYNSQGPYIWLHNLLATTGCTENRSTVATSSQSWLRESVIADTISQSAFKSGLKPCFSWNCHLLWGTFPKIYGSEAQSLWMYLYCYSCQNGHYVHTKLL